MPHGRYRVRKIQATKGAAARRVKLWQAMRILRQFTVADLMAVAEQEQDKKKSVLTYLGQLRRAGYLRTRYGNLGRHEAAHFFLIRDSGPLAPGMVNRGAAMWDWNTETDYPIKGNKNVE